METAVRTKRLEYIDAAKALSILMIMLGHITDLSNPVDVWMSSCKICVFYVISGFLMAHTRAFQKRTPAQFVKNVLSTIAWPYLTFSVIAIAVKCFYVFSKHKGMEELAHTFRDNLGKALFLRGINSMWFLPTLFFGELILLLLYLSPRLIRYLYAFAGLLGLRLSVVLKGLIEGSGLPHVWTEHLGYLSDMLCKSLVAAWFVGAGYVLYLLLKRFDLLHGHAWGKLAAGFVLTVSNIVLSQMNKGVDFNMMKMGDRPWLFIYGGLFGSIGLIMLLDAISSKVSLQAFNYWGKNSLILMCTHTALGFKKMAVAGWAAAAYIPEAAGPEYIFECLMVLGLLMLMMYPVIEIINRHFTILTRFGKRSEGRSN